MDKIAIEIVVQKHCRQKYALQSNHFMGIWITVGFVRKNVQMSPYSFMDILW